MAFREIVVLERGIMYRLLAMDVDGTLTDGGVYIGAGGVELKRFDIQDGMGISSFRKSGGIVAFISGRYSPATEARAKDLGVDFLVNGTPEKLPALKKIAERCGVAQSEVIYAGDDVNDVDCVRWAGLGVAVANAVERLRDCADYVTRRRGGEGAIREITDRALELNAKEVSS